MLSLLINGSSHVREVANRVFAAFSPDMTQVLHEGLYKSSSCTCAVVLYARLKRVRICSVYRKVFYVHKLILIFECSPCYFV
jgi:hypothetical protein